ncbi:hypothetical protein POF51_26525 [Brevibacillus sp. AG]|uniref:hypothetical protein n=1 Tax=Brevibacillus sp. AG TaxID=3020891 RepID=UPI00232D77CD|nr:hypothetical protein [Brevibacillus sp. AG]MDC0764280.1 hypothetical protein [Brevibacillus sp. AG]
MNEELQKIITLLQQNGYSLMTLIDAINKSCDPEKPVILISTCARCQEEFLSRTARVKMNEYKKTLLLCPTCKVEHERERVLERVRNHRTKKKDQLVEWTKRDYQMEPSILLQAMKHSYETTGKLTAATYREWQKDRTEMPSVEDIESVFGSWKAAKAKFRDFE